MIATGTAGFWDGAWLAHLAAFLLVLAMMHRATARLRLWVIASAVTGLAFVWMTHGGWLAALWPALLLAVNLAQLARLEFRERLQRFTPAEEHLRAAVLGGLSRVQARTLIDQGHWVHGRPGERLLSEGEPAGHLFFVHSGSAAVSLGGVPVGGCGPGELIGDATALSGAPATATVTVGEASHLWCIGAPSLRDYVAMHAEVGAVLYRRINDTLKTKLATLNQRLVESAG